MFMADDEQIFKAMLRAGELGALITMHAEIGRPLDILIKRALAEGHTAPVYHALSRPEIAEATGTERAIALAEMAKVPVYMVHLSAQRALERVMEARDRGLPAYAEACPQYLFLGEDHLRGEPGNEFKGAGFVAAPALRQGRVEAVQKQVATLDYAPAFQFGHPASFALANKIKELTPAGLDYVFFCGSGSEAADTSLKIARAYWRAKGQGTKTRLIGREKGYHGVNFGGISVGGIGGNRKVYGTAVEADHLPHTQKPGSFIRGMNPDEAWGAELAGRLTDLLALHDASNIAAVIVEPMAGSAGVIPPPKGYLQKLRDICTANNILLIFDEVITGFGRMGAYTGADAFGVKPDLLNFAKQVTNGVQPLGGVVATKEIYDAFMSTGGPDYMLELAHGYTYSAHPVACAEYV